MDYPHECEIGICDECYNESCAAGKIKQIFKGKRCGACTRAFVIMVFFYWCMYIQDVVKLQKESMALKKTLKEVQHTTSEQLLSMEVRLWFKVGH